MPGNMLSRWLAGAGALAIATGGAWEGAAAGTVTLRSHDGAVALSGELVEFTGEAFVIKTSIGELRINAMQVSCEGEDCPDPALLKSDFTVAGSGAIGAALMPALLLGYADSLDADLVQARDAQGGLEMKILSPDGAEVAAVGLAGAGAGDGFRALLAGEAAIAMSARPIRDREAARFRAAGVADMTDPRHEQVLALDGLVMLVSPRNPVDALSLDDVAAIFAGEITDWAELGGAPGGINLYAATEGAGGLDAFAAGVMAPRGLEIAAGARRRDDADALSDDVALDPGGIGFAGIASIRAAKPLGIRTECGLIAAPDAFGVKTEEYPLARRLFLYTRGGTLPRHAARLLAFAQSDEAQNVIADAGFVDQAIEARKIDAQGMRFAMAFTDPSPEFDYARMRELAGELIAAQRLSATFRFNPGSSQLDNKARGDVSRVVAYLSDPRIGEKQVLIAGFTDSVGRADLNRKLSFRRADKVRASIEAAAPAGALDKIDFKVMGYGELAPVGCNESLSGRRINRRVELWIRDKP